ncbi:hypothetical protein TELCIR_21448 [Teladorsagia circumcincta]|uniref:Uncharacterized protein n=1 Tax=Teladorsagia circumcincta TaxID=45464 RepID=A0A2G9TGW7_TELCI|nr:hypothetical protein TELCIR_21448 [Teladorsagia circumcincta]
MISMCHRSTLLTSQPPISVLFYQKMSLMLLLTGSLGKCVRKQKKEIITSMLNHLFALELLNFYELLRSSKCKRSRNCSTRCCLLGSKWSK